MRNPAARRELGGASASLAGDTEASTPKPAQTQLHAVDVFAAWSEGDERTLRIRIHNARDIAQARACRSKHGRARTIYWLAAQMAADWVFKRAAVGDLKDVIDNLTRLFLVAGSTERMEAPDGE